MTRNARHLAIAIAAAIAAAAVAIVYYKYNPMESSFFPKCMFYKLTGCQCPGCGSQRSLYYFLHGQYGESFRQNPMLWAAVIYITATQALKIRPLSERFPSLKEKLTGLGACISWLIAIIAFWILRNII